MTVLAGSEQRARGAHVAVARQPILDRAEQIAGYELLYRSTHSAPAALDNSAFVGARGAAEFDAVADLAAVAPAYRDALDWVERAAPHLA